MPNKSKFAGKEEQTDLGMGWIDFGARMYLADIARWAVIDNKSEKYFSSSPYNYAMNNPAILVDFDGNDVIISVKNENHLDGLLKFAKTAEGQAYLAQYAKANEKLVINGEVITLNSNGQDGKYSSHDLEFADYYGHAYNPGRTEHFVRNKRGVYKKLGEMGNASVTDVLESAQNPKIKVRIGLNAGKQMDSDEAAYTLGHESFLHDQDVDK